MVMESVETSTVKIVSNIYPVTTDMIVRDRKFLDQISDREGITQLARHSAQRGAYLNKLQRRQYAKVAAHCVYADAGDFPWGTIASKDRPRVICKCNKTNCPLFGECRPDTYESATQQHEEDEEAVAAPTVAPRALDAEEGPATPPNEEVTETADAKAFSGETPAAAPETHAEETAATPKTQSAVDALIEDLLSSIQSDDGHEASSAVVEVPDDYDSTFESPTWPTPPSPTSETHSSPSASSNYDKQQALVVEADPSARLYVNAGPGTGKTHTLIEKLKYMTDVQGVDPDSILVLSFTRAAVAVVRDRLRAAALNGELDSSWQDIDVTTFDKFCTHLLYDLKADDRKIRKNISYMGYDERINYASTCIGNEPQLIAGCQHLIVDETQDLVGPRARLTLTLIECLPADCGVTLLGDRCQSLYDYQAGRSIDSEQFYDKIHELGTFKELELRHNYRQGVTIPYDLTGMRDNMLARNKEGASAELAAISAKFPQPSQPLRDMEASDIKSSTPNGRLAILARTNAETMIISSTLYKLGVHHAVSRRKNEAFPSRLMADIFSNYPAETINERDFLKECGQLGLDDDTARTLWFDLSTLRPKNAEGGRYRVGDLLKTIYEEVLPASLVAHGRDERGIYVSTVHSAKGMEFEDVWLLNTNLSNIIQTPNLDEEKVAYVALSRAISNTRIQKLDSNEDNRTYAFGSTRDSADRCYRTQNRRKGHRGRTAVNKSDKKRLTHFQLLNGNLNGTSDIRFESLCNSTELQRRLAEGAFDGAPLRLELNSHDDNKYSIFLQDEGIKVGEMSRIFTDGYITCYQSALGMEPTLMPQAFDELYVDEVIACVGPSQKAPTFAKHFSGSETGVDYSVWYGFTIGGFAHVDESQGH